MLITKIQELTKNRVKIFLDNEISFVLYKGELRTFKIVEGYELTMNAYEEIFTEILPKRAKLRAMNLLKVRPYTVKGLTDKLTDGGYPEEIISIAIDYVKSFHYLDDDQYAEDYIYTYKERKNKNRIIQDLLNKGVAKEVILKAYDRQIDDDTSYEEEQIANIARKKGFFDREFSYEEHQKLLASLYRKGYSLDLCNKILK